METRLKLSVTERLVLANQFRILERLTEDEHDLDDLRIKREIVESGYERLYGDLLQTIDVEGTSYEDGDFVLDVLDMYRDLRSSYDALEQKDGVDESLLRFKGFDGNRESEFMHFCVFFCERLNRFSEIDRSRGFNSHHPNADDYRAMLSAYKKIAHGISHGPNLSRQMTLSEIQAVLTAGSPFSLGI